MFLGSKPVSYTHLDVYKRQLQDYRQAKMGVPKTELEGKTLGLVGLGNIGKLVAQKAALGFDMTVLAYDPFAKGAGLPDYIRMVEDRDEIFKRSDYVSLQDVYKRQTWSE